MVRIIKVDYDIPITDFKRIEQFMVWRIYFCTMNMSIDVEHIVCTESQSGNTHCVIRLSRDVDDDVAILLQLCYGDDIKRFMLTVDRYSIHSEYFTYLFTFKKRVSYVPNSIAREIGDRIEKRRCVE